MYFGSVRFFKHLIISILILILTALIAVTVFLGLGYSRQKALLASSDEKNAVLLANAALSLPDGKDFDTVFEELKDNGLSVTEIAAQLAPKPLEIPAIAPPVEPTPQNSIPDGLPDYAALYPELYATLPTSFRVPEKTIYLTFDDGPSDNTLLILSILDKYNIKGTFFMTGAETDAQKAVMKTVSDGGHAIGMHSFSHNYKQVYESVDSYLGDMDAIYKNILGATGAAPTIFRFPGGSINNYNRFIYKQLIAETTRRGFVYYDWDVSGEDAKDGADWTSIYKNVMGGVKKLGDKSAIVLLHDASDKDRTVTVVEDLVLELLDSGYTFDKLTNDIAPTTFQYLS